MNYSLLKENKLDKTVKKIKKILKKLGIAINESWLYRCYTSKIMPYSVRLTIENLEQIGTNGKGKSKESALASGYAEFIERLQNQLLFISKNESFRFAPDEVLCNINDLNNNIITKYFSFPNIIADIYNKYFSIRNRIFEKTRNVDDSKVILVPFYSTKEKCTYNMPIALLRFIQCSNGMSAGNTKEEALVQGISEICERYALKQIMLNKISMPDIPEHLYIGYDKIKGLIEYYKEQGYKLHIKDASLGKKLPVVCVIFENLKNNRISIHCGSHPSLPIAIERNLTEFAQGFDVSANASSVNTDGYISAYEFSQLKNKMEYIFEYNFFTKLLIEKNDYLDEILFKRPPVYDFSFDTWVGGEKCKNNKTILKNLLEKISETTNGDIYIRDVSFLNFPSFYIFIPSMSIAFDYDEKNLQEGICFLEFFKSVKNGEFEHQYSLEHIFNALELCLRRYYYKTSYQSLKIDVQIEYLCLLCSIALNNFENVNKYIDIILFQNNLIKRYTQDGIIKFKIMKEYYVYKMQNYEEDKIKNLLISSFSEKDINNCLSFIAGINENSIKKIILKSKKEDRTEEQNSKQIEIIAKKLGAAYKANCINQMGIKKIFDYRSFFERLLNG